MGIGSTKYHKRYIYVDCDRNIDVETFFSEFKEKINREGYDIDNYYYDIEKLVEVVSNYMAKKKLNECVVDCFLKRYPDRLELVFKLKKKTFYHILIFNPVSA